MGRIKSALEIALERTESVKSDRGSIGQFEAKQKGKKLANDFLEGAVKSLEEEINKFPKDEQANLKQGIFDILISQIGLPVVKDELKRIEAAGRGLHAIIGGKRFGETVKQLGQVLNQYINEAAQYEDAIKRQYAPKLRQKEEELSRRAGRAVKIDPFQDPEFVAFYNQNINALKANYQAAVDQVKQEAAGLFPPG
jgi:hypothetical protein